MWLEWSKEAFLTAKKEKKPILLDISAVWCHWCHTMDRLTYDNHEIAEFIKKNFIAIRVDTDKRPDINDRYNVGGWPSTVILANDGEIVSAATYVPPEHMIRFLEDAIERFKKYKPAKEKKGVEKPVKIIDLDVFELVKEFYDPAQGGFGLEPKFPNIDILDFLLWRCMRGKDPVAQKMLEHSLKAMANGEIFDRVGGGFFRYATMRNWSMPHFEKMLEDNARLLGVYLHSYYLFKRDEYLTVANKILFFLFTMLYDQKQGVFYGSQDADEEYCKLPLEKRFTKLPFIDKTIYTDCNAQAALSFFIAAKLDKGYEKVALNILEYLYKNILKGGVLHSSETKAYLLRDHVFLLGAFVHAFNVTQKMEWKARSELAAKALERFYDKKYGGFFDILSTKDAVGKLKQRKKLMYENCAVALILKELARITKNSKYEKMALKSLEAITPGIQNYGPYACTYAIVASELRK